MTSYEEIVRAKATAVRDLADAIAREYAGMGIAAVKFAENWAQAVESMVPPSEAPEVTRWKDGMGDIWVPNSGGGWRVEGDPDDPNEDLMSLDRVSNNWGPMTAL